MSEESKPSGTAGGKKRPWQWMGAMDFLRDQMGKRNTSTNLDDVQVASGEPLPATATSAESTALVATPDTSVTKKRWLEKRLTDALLLWTTRRQDDNDELFGQSVAAQLRCLSTPAKSLAKFNIQKVRNCVSSICG